MNLAALGDEAGDGGVRGGGSVLRQCSIPLTPPPAAAVGFALEKLGPRGRLVCLRWLERPFIVCVLWLCVRAARRGKRGGAEEREAERDFFGTLCFFLLGCAKFVLD